MARRVIFDSSAASPLRISVAGVDAAGAEFNNLIFDANQSPLRLAGTGYLLIDGVNRDEFEHGRNARTAATPSPVVTPIGTTAFFMVMWRANIVSPLFTPYFKGGYGTRGGGGGICSNQFVGVCFNIANSFEAPSTLPLPNYTNYCIFKNYN